MTLPSLLMTREWSSISTPPMLKWLTGVMLATWNTSSSLSLPPGKNCAQDESEE